MHPVISGIFAFVAVDEHQVELPAQFRSDFECRADVQSDLMAVGTARKIRADELLLFVVHLDSVQFGPFVEPRGHRER